MQEIINLSHTLLNKSVIRRNAYYEKMCRLSNSNEVLVVTGQRRSGKSSIVRDFLQGTNCLYFNKELDYEDEITDAKQLIEGVNEWIQTHGIPDYIAIDEIQEITDRQKAVRYWRTKNEFTTIITGSNSELLSGELATYLTGRYFKIEVRPLSFTEFVQFRNIEPTDEVFDEYCKRGGLPELAFLPQDDETQRQYATYIRESIMYKDVMQRIGASDAELMNRVGRFLADISGFEVSHNKIANTLTSHGTKVTGATIARYLQGIEYAMLVDRVSRYDLKGKKKLAYLEKFYFMDHGIRNSRGWSYKKDIGQILETIVYNELRRRGYDVTVGKRYEYEIDFIATRGDEHLAVQVAYIVHDDNWNREIGNLEKIPGNYPKQVISMSPGRNKGVTESGIELWGIKNWLQLF